MEYAKALCAIYDSKAVLGRPVQSSPKGGAPAPLLEYALIIVFLQEIQLCYARNEIKLIFRINM